MLLGDGLGPLGKLDSRWLIFEHPYNPWLEVLGRLQLSRCRGFLQDPNDVGKVSGVGSIASRHTIGAWFDHVLAATRTEASADESQISQTPPPSQFTDGVRQEDPPVLIEPLA
jgi:hypothetical protein